MYAEVKNNNEILINRLDDSERILMQNIYNLSKVSNLSLKELNGETGEFSGVILKVDPMVINKIESEFEIPVNLDIYPNEEYVFKFKTNVDGVQVLFKQDNYDNLDIKSIDNTLVFNTDKLVNAKVQYEVVKEGYIPLIGEFNLASIPRDKIEVNFNKTPEGMNFVLKDEKDTELIPISKSDKSEMYVLPEGIYKVEASKEGFETLEENIEILANDMLFASKDIDITLMGIIVGNE